MAAHPAAEQGGEHVTPARTYVFVFIALLVLTAATVAASFIDLGPLNIVVALGIAFLKASLVVLFFMHVRYLKGFMRFVVAAGFIWFAILILFTLSDFTTRNWEAGSSRRFQVPEEIATSVPAILPSGEGPANPER